MVKMTSSSSHSRTETGIPTRTLRAQRIRPQLPSA